MSRLYSRTYLVPQQPLSDSKRLRVRLGALLESLRDDVSHSLSLWLRREGGLSVGRWDDYSDAIRWYNSCEIPELLDSITLTVDFFQEEKRIKTTSAYKAILDDEFVAYEMFEDGSIHPRIDQAFAFNVEATISQLGHPRYSNARAEFDAGQNALTPINPNWTQATRHTFFAVENIFKQMFNRHPRLGGKELTESLRPVLERRYSSAPPLVKSEANKMLNAFREWVDALHFERHAPGTEEVHTIPTEIGTLLVSQGASYLRWLIEIDIYLQALSSKDT